jgi:hypothetical protein
VSMADQGAERLEDLQAPAAQPEAAGPGSWWSDQPSGAKVCAFRQDTVHLVHTGLVPDWDPDLIREYFQDAPQEFRPPEESPAGEEAEDGGVPSGEAAQGTEDPPGGGVEGAQAPPLLPAEVRGWLETLRFGHEDMWPEAEGQGTTVCLAREEALWIMARGAHRVNIVCEAGEREPEAVPADGGSSLWRLDRAARWRIEVSLLDGPATLWNARWRPAPQLVPQASPATVEGAAAGAEDAVAAGEVPASGPAAVPLWLRYRPALPAALRPYRRQLRTLASAVVLLVACAAVWSVVPKRPVIAAWGQFTDFCAGRYRLRVTTVPPGAALLVDGHDSGVRAPGWLVLHEGKHKVEASLGDYGSTVLEAEGRRGGRATQQASILGRLSLGCADSTVTLFALLDGQAIGRLPVILDSIPAGRRQLSFQGRDVRPWTEEIGVVAGRTTQLMAQPEKVPDHGAVLARAYRVGTEGLKDLPGAAVYVDGKWVASTPARFDVPRGLHTVRLSAGGVSSPVQLLRIEGGQELFATAEFGRSPEPDVVQTLLGPPSAARPPVVRAHLASPMPIRVAEMRLFCRVAGREFRRLPMALRAGASDVEADATLPVTGLAPGSQVSYFVVVKSDEGEEFVGEMKSVKLVP